MQYPIGRTVVLSLLLGGSAALIPGQTASPESRDVTQLPPKTEVKAVTASIAPQSAIVGGPEVALAPPIPLPPPIPARAVAAPTVKVKPSRPATRTIGMLVTAYCPCRKCCGKFSDGMTASGKDIYTNRSMFVAADTRLLKFGTMVSIPGYCGGRAVPVLDRGSKIRGRRLDVFFRSHSRARKWGKQYLDVKVRLDNR